MSSFPTGSSPGEDFASYVFPRRQWPLSSLGLKQTQQFPQHNPFNRPLSPHHSPPAVDVFFGVTKLFQSTDGNLRRLVYLFLRLVADSTDASSLIIVTQSLVKDAITDTPLYKGNALRVLGSIVDVSMLGQLERYFKQMLVDKDDYVASATLTTSLLLVGKPGALETISRWSGEVQTVLTTRTDMVQFHALALLRSIKRHDRLAVSKIVVTLMRSGMRSPLGLCLLIRYGVSLLEADAATINVAVRACLPACA